MKQHRQRHQHEYHYCSLVTSDPEEIKVKNSLRSIMRSRARRSRKRRSRRRTEKDKDDKLTKNDELNCHAKTRNAIHNDLHVSTSLISSMNLETSSDSNSKKLISGCPTIDATNDLNEF